MFRSAPGQRLDRSLAATFGTITGVLLVVLGMTAAMSTAYSFQRERASFVSAVANTLAESTESVGFSGKYHTRRLFENLVAENEALVFVSLMGPDGFYVAHSDPERNGSEVPPEAHLLSLEQIAAGEQATRAVWVDGVKTSEVHIPIRGGFGDALLGVLVVGVHTPTWWQRLVPTAGPILLATAGLLALAVPVFLRLSRQYAAPITRQALQLDALISHAPLYIALRDGDDRLLMESDLLKQLRERSTANDRAVRSLLRDIPVGGGGITEERLTLDEEERVLLSIQYAIALPGGPVEHLWIASDTTLLRRASAERDRFASIVAASPQAIALASKDGVIEVVNPAFRSVLGGRGSDIPGLGLWGLLEGAGTAQLAEIREALLGGVEWRGVLQLRGEEDELAPFRVALAPTDEGGVAFTARNVSRELATQEQLQHSQKMEAVGRLAGGVAHDFNNLLTVILMAVELLRQHSPDDEGFQEDVLTVLRAAERGKDLTAQLLSFGSRRAREPVLLRVGELVEETVGMLRTVMGPSGEIRSDVEDALWPVFADRGQLLQVLMNLGFNAKDAVKDVGCVQIGARNRPSGETEGVGVDEVEVYVSDDGEGIPPHLLSRICEPFFTTKPVGEGSGLGLSIVHGILEQNGGRLEIDSEVGAGTTMHIFLPRARGEIERDGGLGLITGSGERLLVVDDEPDVCLVVARTLRGAGYTVESFTSPTEVLSRLDREPKPQVVLTDLAMPGLSGIELGERIVAHHPGVRVVYMSGYGAEYPEVEGQPFVAKPPAPSELLRMIRKVLDSETP